MKKIPTLFERDWDGDRRYVLPKVSAGCEWVTEGEGIATRKFDGTCVMHDGEQWWARREVKEGKPSPEGFVALGTDPETGKTVGWEPAEQSPFAKHLVEARRSVLDGPGSVGTWELCGPKVNGNPEGFRSHVLIPHRGADKLPDAPHDFDDLAAWLHAHPYEGIVWHHPDGRMAKIKKRDFRQP